MNHYFLTQISNGINAILLLDPDSTQRLNLLSEKVIRIEFKPFRFQFECTFSESGVHIQQDNTLIPDVTLRGTPLQLFGVMIEKESRHHFFAEDLEIEGNAIIAQHVTELLDQLDIDWQEQASKVLGDVATHHISEAIGSISSWLDTAHLHLTEDINHYLHDEKAWFPTRLALQDFFTEVDDTRMAIDRAEAKLNYLSQLLKDETLS